MAQDRTTSPHMSKTISYCWTFRLFPVSVVTSDVIFLRWASDYVLGLNSWAGSKGHRQVHASVKVLTTVLHCLWRGCTKVPCQAQVNASVCLAISYPALLTWPSGDLGTSAARLCLSQACCLSVMLRQGYITVMLRKLLGGEMLPRCAGNAGVGRENRSGRQGAGHEASLLPALLPWSLRM